jgi:Di-haem oxidoreductase, putative peroxidase
MAARPTNKEPSRSGSCAAASRIDSRASISRPYAPRRTDGLLSPGLKDDVYTALKSMSRADILAYAAIDERSDNQFLPRGGGGFFPTKTIDLNGVRDRKYLNHTATHLNRGVGDIMRYVLNVTCCQSGIFGSYRVPVANTQPLRYSDDVLFALATYIYSLEPPSSPYHNDPVAGDGMKIFEREGCGRCHTPPLYTNNKLTLAKGFTPPADHPYKNDIMPASVGTDPGRAMRTQVGTGFYVVPSLRGVWYRNYFGHQADVASLEDSFDPAGFATATCRAAGRGSSRAIELSPVTNSG